ncbi:hypothetical protein WSK_1909 [Novosphingobium sp. Rr 2-17]|uniref:acetoacetate decarboxylase family protein n=1 Tax=Novosphingobium sp. Rr 2-17 TaxID=555793 RepID=UPI0002697EA7|nr:acetoacetate decarboxylase family protein [Novosphingobium sp. Rr 2-17]EIZ79512.1 hypothetical protein WSK_1909 [Novosphingobium sp. Rr 2-17]
MGFKPQPGEYYRMPVFFGPTPGPRSWPADVEIDFEKCPKSLLAGARFLGNREQLQALLPDCFTVADEPIVTCNAHYLTELGWLAGRGYGLFDVKFDVIYRGEEEVRGTLVLVRFESLSDPILSGREELGHNKLWCEITELRSFNGTRSMDLSWLGRQFCSLKVDNLVEAEPPARHPDHQGMMSYKYIPATGDWGETDVAYATLSPHQPSRLTSYYTCDASAEWMKATWAELPTLHHVVNGFAGLEVLEWREGFLMTLEGADSGSTTRRLK